MSTLDSSIVNIALPVISRQLHVSFAAATWTITIYLLVLVSLLLFFGKLGDTFGKVKVFKFGMIIFTLGSLVASFNLGFSFLLIARSIQAIGGAMTMANSFGITAQIFKPEERSRAMAIIAMFVSLGLIAGPAIGGLILQMSSWNMIFMMNIPLGIIGYLIGRKAFPKMEQSNKFNLDILGNFIFLALMMTFFLGLNNSNLILLGLSVIFLIFFIKYARNAKNPLLPLTIFSNKKFSISVFIAIVMFTAGTFNTILLPYYFQDFRHISSGLTGLLLLAYPLGVLIFSPIAGNLADKFDKEFITFLGISGALIASIGFLLIHSKTSVFYVFACLLLYGAAIGFFKSPNNTLIMSSVEKSQTGIAGSINSLSNYLGVMIGTAFATLTLFASLSNLTKMHITNYTSNLHPEFLNALHFSFLIAAFIVGIAWILSLSRILSSKNTLQNLHFPKNMIY